MNAVYWMRNPLSWLVLAVVLAALAGCDNDGYYITYDRPYYSGDDWRYDDDYRRPHRPKVVIIDTPHDYRDVCGVCRRHDCDGCHRRRGRYEHHRYERYERKHCRPRQRLDDRRRPPRFPPPGEDWDDGEWEWDDDHWEWDD